MKTEQKYDFCIILQSFAIRAPGVGAVHHTRATPLIIDTILIFRVYNIIIIYYKYYVNYL